MLAIVWGQAFHGMSWINVTVVWIIWCFAVLSFLLNREAAKVAIPPWNKLYKTIHYLSFVYIVAYLVLLFGPFSAADWSIGMRYVGLIVWPLVWCGPAYARILGRKAIIEKTTEQVLTILEEEIKKGNFHE